MCDNGPLVDVVLRHLQWVCERHIDLNNKKRRRVEVESSDLTDGDVANEVSDVISSVLCDYLRCLQDDTSRFDTYDVLNRCTDELNSRRKGIKYCMWSRLPRRRSKSIYHQLLKRRLGFLSCSNEEYIRDCYIRSLRYCKRSINVWGHHLCLGEIDLSKTYNEPPEVHILRFDKTGDVIITGGDEGIIKLWHTYNCKLIMSLKKHTGGITSIDVHDTNVFILSTCDGGELWLWEINGNFYRPHKVIKINFKYLWARFTKTIPRLTNGRGYESDWNDNLNNTRIISVDANSRLYIYNMTDLLTSSSGSNIYKPVTPLYTVDLYNHNINAYDLSKTCLSNGLHLVALGIEPLINDLDIDLDVSIALNFIKNDTSSSHDKTLYGKFKNNSGFCLFTVDVDGKFSTSGSSSSSTSNIKYCHCDVNIATSLNFLNLCKFCNGVKCNVINKGYGQNEKYRDNKINGDNYHHNLSGDRVQQNISFIWGRNNCSDFEKYLMDVIMEIKPMVYNYDRPNNLKLTSYNMPIGRLSSTIIITDDDYLVCNYNHDNDPGDFNTLLFNSITDSHHSSPDVCFANLSLTIVTASDDGMIYLWKHLENENFERIQLVTKTLDKWNGNLKEGSGGKKKNGTNERSDIGKQSRDVDIEVGNNIPTSPHVSTSFLEYNNDCSFKTTDTKREDNLQVIEDKGDVDLVKPQLPPSKPSLRDSGQLFIVVNLSWSINDKYIIIADSIIGKSNIRKMITNVKTIYSGISIFDINGNRCNDLLHGKISYHVSCISVHPKCDCIIVVATYDGNIFILDIEGGNIIKKLKCGTHSVWLDIQWHPHGHIFAASQKYGCFSIFTLYDDDIYKLTPNYQCSYNDYYCNINSFSTNAYGGYEESNIQLSRYYYGYSSSPPIVIDDICTYNKIQYWGIPPTHLLLDEDKNSIEVVSPTICNMKLDYNFEYIYNNILINVLIKLPYHTNIIDYINAHKIQINNSLQLIKSFITLYNTGKIDICYHNGMDCNICKYLSNYDDIINKYNLLKDSDLFIKSIINESGDIINTLPLSSRPQQEIIQVLPDRPIDTIRKPIKEIKQLPKPIIIEPITDNIITNINDDINKSEHIYSFRAKRGSLDYKKDKELDLAKKITSSIGPIILTRFIINNNRTIDNYCVFCGLGSTDYSHGVTSRLQSLKLSRSLFKQKHSIHPGGSILSKNILLGPYNIPRRFITQLEELTEVAKRIGTFKGDVSIYTHSSCLVACSFLKLDHTKSKILNLPEILVRASHVRCSFCDDIFATIHCSNNTCTNVYHYPCSLACYKKNSFRGQYELLNILDPLTCDSFICVDCVFNNTEMSKYLNYITSSSFEDLSSRKWLYDTNADKIGNLYIPQIGDVVVLLSTIDYPLVNVANLWAVNNLPCLYTIKDLDYQFIGPFDETSVAIVLLLEAVSISKSEGDDEDSKNIQTITVYYTLGMPLILFRDLLSSIYTQTILTSGDAVNFYTNDQLTTSSVADVKDYHTFDEHMDLKDVKIDLILKDIIEIGSNSIQIDNQGTLHVSFPTTFSFQYIQWMSVWNVFKEENEVISEIIKKLNDNLSPEYIKEQFLQITLNDRFSIFNEHDDNKMYNMSIVYPLYMDIIRHRIINGYYRRAKSIYFDFSVLIKNCKEYNVPNSDYVRLVKEVEKELNAIEIYQVDELQEILELLWPLVNKLFNHEKDTEFSEVTKRTQPSRRMVEYFSDEEDFYSSDDGIRHRSTSHKKAVHQPIVQEPKRYSMRLLENTRRLEQLAANSRRRQSNTRYNLRGN